MTRKQGDKLLGQVKKFLQDNEGDKVTFWNGSTLMAILGKEIKDIVEQDSRKKDE